jgi:hypothetical protein
MIKTYLMLLVLIFAVTFQINAQGKSKLEDCRKLVVQDSDRRGFDELESFKLDVDGDGKLDTITPRPFTVYFDRNVSAKIRPPARIFRWIAFDLKTGKGQVYNSFFKYKCGENDEYYWVYALVPCKVDGESRALLFYSGDDTTEEMVILMNTGKTFKIISRKEEALGL